jgi:hypothetical protein
MMTPVSYAAFEAVTDRASAMTGSVEVGMATTLFVIYGLTAVLYKSPTGPLVIPGGRETIGRCQSDSVTVVESSSCCCSERIPDAPR